MVTGTPNDVSLSYIAYLIHVAIICFTLYSVPDSMRNNSKQLLSK